MNIGNIPVGFYMIKEELASLKVEIGELAKELISAREKLSMQKTEKQQFSVVLDVVNELILTAKKKADKAVKVINSFDELTNSDLQFRLLVTNVKEYAIFTLDNEGRVSSWNSGAENIKGYTENEIIGKPLDIFYTKDEIDKGEPQRNLLMALNYGHYETEGFRVRKDGSLFYANVSLTAIVNRSGRLFGYSEITRDLSEIKKVEQDMKRLTSRLLLATESAQMGIWDWDIINKVLVWDKRMYSLYNVEDGQFNQRYEEWFLKIHPEDMQRVGEEMRLALEGKQDYRPEFRIIWNDSSVHYIKASAIVERDGAGNAVRMTGANWDITDQKVAEKVRDKIIADIDQRNIDLAQFSYIVSHNLRAPVANILGITAIINDPGNSVELNNRMNRALSSSAKQLDDVIKDLNYILQVKRENIETKIWVQFSEIVSNIKGIINSLIEKDQVAIKTDFSEVDAMFTTKAYLYSIFYNLIINSIKYRQHNTNPKIEIKSLKLNGKIVLVFKDNGHGIDMKKNGKYVFGLYKRFHTHADGKGLGLYMVKTQVELLGGKIFIESEINKGTEFRLEFSENDSITL